MLNTHKAVTGWRKVFELATLGGYSLRYPKLICPYRHFDWENRFLNDGKHRTCEGIRACVPGKAQQAV